MIAYLLLGVLLLVALLLLVQGFARAEPARLARALRWSAAAALVGFGIFLALTGRLPAALAAAAVLFPLFMRWRALWARMKGALGPKPGQTSTIETAFVRMTLDHDSGEIAGEVLAGRHRGRRLADLDREELVELLAEARAGDPQAAALIEAYLDRRFGPDWREEGPPGGEAGASGFRPGAMTREEAYEILGLEPGAGEEEIKAAYHRLMLKLHPDQGGSTYLAAKINEARDLLLGG